MTNEDKTSRQANRLAFIARLSTSAGQELLLFIKFDHAICLLPVKCWFTVA